MLILVVRDYENTAADHRAIARSARIVAGFRALPRQD